MAATYTAVLRDPDDAKVQASYPGVFFREDGSPMTRILVRYTSVDGQSRMTAYEPDGAPADEEDRIGYLRVADEPYDHRVADQADWLIVDHAQSGR